MGGDRVQAVISRLEKAAPGRGRPKTAKSQIRSMMPALEAARERGLLWKEIHQEVLAAGIQIAFQVFANYVCKFRREALSSKSEETREQSPTHNEGTASETSRRGERTDPKEDHRAPPDRPYAAARAATGGLGAHANVRLPPNSGSQPEQYVETINGDRPTKVRRPT